MVIKTLENKAVETNQDGVVLDFRNEGVQMFLIDKSRKVLHNDRRYRVTIELINEYKEEEWNLSYNL